MIRSLYIYGSTQQGRGARVLAIVELDMAEPETDLAWALTAINMVKDPITAALLIDGECVDGVHLTGDYAEELQTMLERME